MGLRMKTLIAFSIGACALFWSGNIPLNMATSGVTSLVSTAEAQTATTKGRTAKRVRHNRGDRHGTRVYH